MSDLVPYHDGLSRRGRRDLQRVTDAAAVTRRRVEGYEDGNAYQADRRVANVYALSERTADHHTELHRRNIERAGDDAALAMDLGAIERNALLASVGVINRYGNMPL